VILPLTAGVVDTPIVLQRPYVCAPDLCIHTFRSGRVPILLMRNAASCPETCANTINVGACSQSVGCTFIRGVQVLQPE
jgi:hypothetical protein